MAVDALSRAKEALASAQNFTRSVEKDSAPPKATPAAPAKTPSGLAPARKPMSGTGLTPPGEDMDVKGSMAKGGTVKETGNYKLHKGEKVIPKDEAEKKAKQDTPGRVKEVLGGKSKKKKSKIKGMHVRHASSGGYITKHEPLQSQEPGTPPQEPEEHIIPDMEALKQHMEEHMSQPDSDQDQGAPQGA